MPFYRESQGRQSGRPQGHEPLGRSLELDQEHDSPAIDGFGGPDQVGMAQLQRLLADELGVFLRSSPGSYCNPNGMILTSPSDLHAWSPGQWKNT